MTAGALIFAYNNDEIDYVSLAAWSAARIRRHLDIPVALVTDRPTDHEFDRVIIHASPATHTRWFSDLGRRVIWNNQSRPDAWDLSPWDRTLMLDADYVVASDQLRLLLADTTAQILCHRHATDAAGSHDFDSLNRFGRYHMPMYWATVMLFDRSSHSRHVFDCMKMIRDNWSHFKNIYQDRAKNYRNDHALSIALNTVNGHQLGIDHIPWSLVSVLPEYRLQQTDADRFRIDFVRGDNRAAWLEIADQDFHAMGKQSLMELIR